MENQITQQSIDCMTKHLLGKHGSVMFYEHVADELKVTVEALKQRQHRHHDLPPYLDGMRRRAWPTPTIARWLLCGHESERPTPLQRGPGRPRKRAQGGV